MTYRFYKFWEKSQKILLYGGITLSLILLVLYNFWKGDLSLNVAGIYRIVLTILLGFGASASLAGIAGSVIARRIDINIIEKAPTAEDYSKVVNDILPKFNTAKEERQNYLQISLLILFLNLCKDIIAYFIE